MSRQCAGVLPCHGRSGCLPRDGIVARGRRREPAGSLTRAVALVLMALALSIGTSRADEPLPALGANLAETSVSGVSSGAYMAGQFQVAHSKLVVGAGLVAGGPYGCAESVGAELTPYWSLVVMRNVGRALNACMSDTLSAFGVPSMARLVRRAESRAEDGKIDSLDGLKADRIYLFSGKKDQTVVRSVVEKAAAFYEDVGVPKSQILVVKDPRAGHAFVTEESGTACEVSEPPFVADCDYDQAGAILTHIYGPLAAPTATLTGRFVVFDQRPFHGDQSGHGLAETGTVYVPESCTRGPGCRVHVVFHGCRQNRAAVSDAFVKGSGYARWADSNRMIVLFPEAEPSAVNPKGCWDWWGYTGRDFLARDAAQTAAVRRMLEQLARTPDG